MMMQLVSNGKVVVERERPHGTEAKMSSVRARRMTQGLKKTMRPELMSKDEFFRNIIQGTQNGNVFKNVELLFSIWISESYL